MQVVSSWGLSLVAHYICVHTQSPSLSTHSVLVSVSQSGLLYLPWIIITKESLLLNALDLASKINLFRLLYLSFGLKFICDNLIFYYLG